MINLRNKLHGEIIKVCIGIYYDRSKESKNIVKFSIKDASPYFHSASLVV